MGQVYSNFSHINYEELQTKLKKDVALILLNTLSSDNQSYLIKGTLKASYEIGIMNDYLKKKQKH